MPFTVITLKKVPNALRGDLTRWMQEIATGVYVGNFNSKVREYLWKRIMDSVGQGEASMCFSCRNEIGYSFSMYNTSRQVVDYDGIPLVLIPAKDNSGCEKDEIAYGFSNASKCHIARRISGGRNCTDRTVEAINGKEWKKTAEQRGKDQDKVFIDLETTGLNVEDDKIIEIGAIKVSGDHIQEFSRLIHIDDLPLSPAVKNLTGITDNMLLEGVSLGQAVKDVYSFILDTVLIGYNIQFDVHFLNKAFEQYSLPRIQNTIVDIMREAKKKNSFQDNYKFETTLRVYGINQTVPHRAMEDAKLMHQLFLAMGLN